MAEDEFEDLEALEAEAEAAEEEEKEVKESPRLRTVPAQGKLLRPQQNQVRPAQAPQNQAAQAKQTVPAQPKAQATEAPNKERYTIEHQPEIVALVDNVTGEAIVLKAENTIKDLGPYQVQAKILNELEIIMVGAGYNQ